MWKLLSGIALVVLLDVAFIWMIAVEPEAPEIAQNIGPTAALPVLHDQQISEPVAIDDSTEPVVEDSSELPDIQGSGPNRRGFRRVRGVAQPNAPTVAATAPPKLFQDTIIWIGRTEVPVKIDQPQEAPLMTESELYEPMQASLAEPRTANKKKRSFESKAFSVIKKPYDWMRAFARKFD
ncbi:MAG: hypothetical protein PSX80_16950 [bacterium]|nr:hypothetical protein [bacterium]